MEYRKEPVKGFEEYSVDTKGIVFSKKNKPLKYSINHNGYCIVNFYVNGKRKGFGVHTIVANQFIPNSDKSKTQVNHKNGDKTDNSVENLEWVTPKENMKHSVEHLGRKYGWHNEKAISCYDVKTGIKKYDFSSLLEAAQFLFDSNVNKKVRFVEQSIYRALNNFRKTYKGYVWRYTRWRGEIGSTHWT